MRKSTICFVIAFLLLQEGIAFADARSKAAVEVAEYVAQKFGKEAIKDGVETFTRRLALAASRHGDDVLVAVRRVGPSGLHAVEEAGEHGGKIARLITVHGEEAIICVVKRPKGLALLAQHGESAGAALCKHHSIAEPLIEKLGEPAVRALTNVGPQSGRRLAMMAESGELARIGKTEQLLGVIARFGDAGATWVWNHKGALAVSATLVAFLSNPEPFIQGTVQLAEPIADLPGKVIDDVVAPTVQTPAKAVTAATEEAAKRTDWTVVMGLLVVGGIALAGLRAIHKHRVQTQAEGAQQPKRVPR